MPDLLQLGLWEPTGDLWAECDIQPLWDSNEWDRAFREGGFLLQRATHVTFGAPGRAALPQLGNKKINCSVG